MKNFPKFLRACAKTMQEQGFSPELGDVGHPQCFLGVADTVIKRKEDILPKEAILTTNTRFVAWIAVENCLLKHFGIQADYWSLKAEEWTTKDAVAVLEMAADLES